MRPNTQDQPNGTYIRDLLDLKLEDVLPAISEAIGEQLIKKLRPGAVQPRLFTIKQAAVYLGRTEKAIYHLVTTRGLPSVRSDSRIMLDRRDLDNWIEQNKA